MSNRTTLKGYFVTNAIPKQSDFADLIDSAFVQTEDSIRKQGADPVAIQAQQADQNGIQQALHFYKTFNDANAAWKFSLLTQNTTNPASGLNIGNPPTVQSSLFIKETDGSIGIGTNNPTAKLHVSGGNAVIDGNVGIGTATPNFPLNFSNAVGDKISLWGKSGNHYGFGIQGGLLQIHADTSAADIAFGYGSSSAFTEAVRIKGNGNVGIGSSNPVNKLEVNGSIHTNGNPIYFRQGTSDKYDFIQWSGVNGGDLLEIAGFSGVKLGYSSATGSGTMTDVLTVSNNGYVGIGTTNPRSKLDIGILSKGQLGSVLGRLAEGDTSDSGTFLGVRGYVTQVDNDNPIGNIKSFAIEHGFYGQVNSSINFFRGGDRTGGFLSFCTNNNTERVRIDPAGNVGIGTSSPSAKLHVAGSLGFPLNSNYGYLSYNGAGSNNPVGNVATSILTSDRIVASEFDAISDKRMKKDLVINNSKQSLETINQIQIKSFHYKDDIQHGSAWNKGVIAQELETVFPEAVIKHTDFVPDIYSLPQSAIVSNNILTVTMESPHDLVTGDTVRIITASGIREVQVVKISDTNFSVKDWHEETTDIFVYGKQVKDCRTVNYNSIFCLGISAIQELYKQLQQLREELNIIKERVPLVFAPTM